MQAIRPIRIFVFAGSLAFLGGCVPFGGDAEDEPVPSGAEDFATYCVTCHGTSGRGDGVQAATLARRPADLTRLSSQNGGVFPITRVMAKIWGYTARDGEVMPQFAPLLDSENMVLFDGGDGIQTPTPRRLVQLGQFVEGLQE